MGGSRREQSNFRLTLRPAASGSELRITSDTRVYLVKDAAQTHWAAHKYERIDLRSGAPMRFTLDLSQVPCGCLACVYLVAMPEFRPEVARLSRQYAWLTMMCVDTIKEQ